MEKIIVLLFKCNTKNIVKNIGQGFGIALLTLFVGVATVLLFNRFHNSEGFTTVNKSELENSTIFKVAPPLPRFTKTFPPGCSLGYFQAYITNDGLKLFERELGCEKPKNRDKRIVHKDNEKIVSKIESEDKTYYEIYRFKNGHCIHAPTKELGLEFEKWQASEK